MLTPNDARDYDNKEAITQTKIMSSAKEFRSISILHDYNVIFRFS